MQQQVVGRRAAIDPQFAECVSGILLHRLQHLGTLEGDGFQSGTSDARARGATGHAEQGAARIGVPVRRPEAGVCRHQIDAAAVGHRGGQRLDLGRRGDHAQAVTQPLHDGAAHEDAAFEQVGRFAATLPADGTQQAMARGYRRIAGIHHQEAAGAVGVLGHAARQTVLPEGSGLLVTGNAGQRHFRAQPACIDSAGNTAAVDHLRQYGGRNVEQRQQFLVPAAAMDIEEQRTRGVRGIGDMLPAGGQLPGQPAVDSAEGKFALFGATPRIGKMVEQPLEFGAGKIRIKQQAGATGEPIGVAGFGQRRAQVSGTPVLPDDGRRQRLAGGAVPEHGGFALVGDADGSDTICSHTVFAQHGAGDGELALPDFLGVMLDPAGLRIRLRELLLGNATGLAAAVKKDGARTGGALVEGQHVVVAVAAGAHAISCGKGMLPV